MQNLANPKQCLILRLRLTSVICQKLANFEQLRDKLLITWPNDVQCLLHFVAFFHVASLFSTRVDNKKVGVDNKKALELTHSTIFHRGRQ